MPRLRSSTTREYDRAFEEVSRYIDANLGDDITLDMFCSDMAYKRRSVQRALRYYGTTWRSLLIRRRLQSARTLLVRTDLTVREIADEVGYNQPAHFAKAFAKEYGTNPREYRQEHRTNVHA